MDQTVAILDRLTKLHPRSIDLSLGRLEVLLEKLGTPHRALPPTIHIAGTNGKGSTTAYMRSILEAGGKRVHAYTSPHLVRFHERIRLAGELVSDDALIAAMLDVERVNDGTEITQFEVTTAIAFKLFCDNPADVLLLEVGLGGRFDATNVIDSPVATLITPISMDHESFLGTEIAGIAFEKAGIIKPNAPVIVARQVPEVLAVIAETAKRIGAPLCVFGQDFDAYAEHGRMVYQTENSVLDLPLPNLFGQHQIGNAAMAISALEQAGLLPSTAQIENGVTSAIWPARLQRLQAKDLKELGIPGAEIWLDGGHNPGAGVAIAQFMASLQERVERPLVLIAGMLQTKDPVGYFEPFHGLAKQVYTLKIPSSNASCEAEELAAFATEAGLSAQPVSSIREALKAVLENAAIGAAPRILICGSLYLAGDVLKENGTYPT